MSPIALQKNAYAAQMEVHSPTPIAGEDDEMTLDSPAPIVRQSSAEGLKPVAGLVEPHCLCPRVSLKLTLLLPAASRVSAVRP